MASFAVTEPFAKSKAVCAMPDALSTMLLVGELACDVAGLTVMQLLHVVWLGLRG